MQISNETKVGALTVIAVTLLVLGYNFLKGKTISRKSNVIYAKFYDIGGLDISNPVKIKGYRIGNVYDITSKDAMVSEVVVAISLSENIQIPDNSVATIINSLTGISYINILPGKNTTYLNLGDTLNSATSPDMLAKVMTNVDPLLITVKNAADTLQQLLNAFNKILDLPTQAHFRSIIQELDQSSKNLNTILDTEKGALSKTLKNTEKFSANLTGNNENLNTIIENLKSTSQQLASSEISVTIDNLNQMVADLKLITEKLKTKEGTMGLLINDPALYNDLLKTNKSINTLVDDLKVNPKRYINVSVFGKKDKSKPLKAPLSDSIQP